MLNYILVPGAPVLLTVTTVGTSEVTIQWEYPDRIDQNGPIERFHISYISLVRSVGDVFTHNIPNPIPYPADPSIQLSITHAVDLVPGVYIWFITAENGAGISEISNIITIVVSEIEYIIEEITVLNSTSTELSIRWTVSSDQSISLIEYYNITLQADTILTGTLVFQVFPIQVVNITDNTFEYTINGLQEFLSYNIRVIIVTFAGEVFMSTASTNAATTQEAPSGAPQSIMPVAISSTVLQLYWYPPPAVDQNGLITHYILTYVGTFFDDTNRFIQINATDGYPSIARQGPYNITGLQEYNNYTIELNAVNAVGDGPLSTKVTQLTNQAVSDASPLDLMGGSLSSNAVYLTWLPPPGVNQNGPITHYNISYTGTPLDTTLRFELFVASPVLYPADSVPYSYNITGLQAYTDYSITISAINGAGVGPATAPVIVTTEAIAPDAAPLNLTATAIDSTRIQVSWNPPPSISQNGEITSYNITFYGCPFDTVLQYDIIYIMSIYPDTMNYTSILIGLQEYNNYTISISAVNSVGEGPATLGITVLTGIGASDLPPESLIARSINATSIAITWLPPPPLNQNGPILYYNITYRGVPYDTTPRSILFQVAQPTYPTNLTGEVTVGILSPYTEYTVGVSAVTLGGIGVFGYTQQRTDEAAPTSPPLITQLTPTSATEVSLSWSPPPNTEQNGIITHYVIYYNASLFSNLTYNVTYLSNCPSYPDTGTYTDSIIGLEEYVLYTFSIQAYTIVGSSPNSPEETVETFQAVPGAPVLLTVTTVGTSEVTIQWESPDRIDQNGPIVRYHISYITSMFSAASVFTYDIPNPITYPADPSIPLSATYTVQLDSGVYVWFITSENGAGISAKSNNITEVVSNFFMNVGTITATASIGICCIFLILHIVLIFACVLLLFCRRSKTTKINTVEAAAVEMKLRTVFSNQSSLKELDKQGVDREAIYAVIGNNKYSSESAAERSVVVNVANPIEIPKGKEVGLSTSLPVVNDATDPPTVVIAAADISGEYISEAILNDESELMETTEEHSLHTVEPGELALGDEDSEHYIQDQESQII